VELDAPMTNPALETRSVVADTEKNAELQSQLLSQEYAPPRPLEPSALALHAVLTILPVQEARSAVEVVREIAPHLFSTNWHHFQSILLN